MEDQLENNQGKNDRLVNSLEIGEAIRISRILWGGSIAPRASVCEALYTQHEKLLARGDKVRRELGLKKRKNLQVEVMRSIMQTASDLLDESRRLMRNDRGWPLFEMQVRGVTTNALIRKVDSRIRDDVKASIEQTTLVLRNRVGNARILELLTLRT